MPEWMHIVSASTFLKSLENVVFISLHFPSAVPTNRFAFVVDRMVVVAFEAARLSYYFMHLYHLRYFIQLQFSLLRAISDLELESTKYEWCSKGCEDTCHFVMRFKLFASYLKCFSFRFFFFFFFFKNSMELVQVNVLLPSY